jgi:hypothetical protein
LVGIDFHRITLRFIWIGVERTGDI